jgi:peptide-N4-(N-acetyl-beta-glucosaminyl)asparagine amidase
MKQLTGCMSKTRQYYDELVKAMCISVIPEHVMQIQEQVPQLKALLAWFKSQFFKWTDKPSCPCGSTADLVEKGENGVCTPEEIEGDAKRVEIYKCTVCTQELRFPRYNSVIKLLETRNGRCGEWANCFTAMCIALGHEARLVLDWTDHVWTECYINEERRWVHMDSCENAYDTPKLYERGWGKKLTYVMSFSNVDVVDTTARYVLNKIANRMRRDLVPEMWLGN